MSDGAVDGAVGGAVVRTIRVVLPAHLRTLAGIHGEVSFEIDVDAGDETRAAVTQRRVLDALEVAYPSLYGTVRDRETGQRRPFIRFFACEEDLSHDSPDTPLPDPVVQGREPFIVLGAIAGG